MISELFQELFCCLFEGISRWLVFRCSPCLTAKRVLSALYEMSAVSNIHLKCFKEQGKAAGRTAYRCFWMREKNEEQIDTQWNITVERSMFSRRYFMPCNCRRVNHATKPGGFNDWGGRGYDDFVPGGGHQNSPFRG